MSSFQIPSLGGSEPSVPVTDKAQTFEESDVTLSHTKTSVVDGKVSMSLLETVTGGDNPSFTGTFPNERGIFFNSPSALDSVSVRTYSAVSGMTRIRLIERGTGPVVTKDVTGVDTSAEWTLLKYPMSANTDYAVVGDAEGADYDLASQTQSLDSTTVNHAGDYNDGTWTDGDTARNFNEVEYGVAQTGSGSVTVEWDAPADFVAWGIAALDANPSGETVDLFVEEETSPGSWTEVAGPIIDFDDIPASASNNVRLRVDIDRASTSNTPAANAVYRTANLIG